MSCETPEIETTEEVQLINLEIEPDLQIEIGGEVITINAC
jgi:hypothetical protein